MKTGVVKQLAHLAITATGGNTLLATMVILAASLVISGFVNNVPYAATMAPIVADLAPALTDHANPGVLWWALALGTDFGGNLTAVGASANVVDPGNRRACRQSHLLLGIHPQGRGRHGDLRRAVRALPVAALLRVGLSRDCADGVAGP